MAPGMMTVNTNYNLSGWSLDYGYESSFNEDEYPMRLTETGPLVAPTFILQTIKDNVEYQCKGIERGFKVFLTMPGDTMERVHNFYRAHVAKHGLSYLDIKHTTTSSGLSRYALNQRKCFFNAERQLRFFKMYTQNNCEAECLANFTKIACGCVKFSMPRTISFLKIKSIDEWMYLY